MKNKSLAETDEYIVDVKRVIVGEMTDCLGNRMGNVSVDEVDALIEKFPDLQGSFTPPEIAGMIRAVRRHDAERILRENSEDQGKRS